MSGPYRVITRWDGREWRVRVEDGDGFHCGETTADDLDEVEGEARALLDRERSKGGVAAPGEPVDVVVEVQLHPDVELRFNVAEELVEDASGEVEGNVAAMRRAGMSAHDIAIIVASRALTAGPRRPLVVPDTEVASAGLDDGAGPRSPAEGAGEAELG